MICAYCGKAAQGNYSVHRDGFGIGPEVDLCDECGDANGPSLDEIWQKIANPEPIIDELQKFYEQRKVKPRGHN